MTSDLKLELTLAGAQEFAQALGPAVSAGLGSGQVTAVASRLAPAQGLSQGWGATRDTHRFAGGRAC